MNLPTSASRIKLAQELPFCHGPRPSWLSA
jgi:hypothetical protein